MVARSCVGDLPASDSLGFSNFMRSCSLTAHCQLGSGLGLLSIPVARVEIKVVKFMKSYKRD